MALLDGDEVVYVAQVPSRHSMRMFTEVGRRVLPHSTGVGKALLAHVPPQEVRALLGRTGMPAATEKTITEPDAFLAELERIRGLGYALDDNEQEIGVRCLAVTVPDSPTAAAISISGPAGRVTEAATDKIVPILQDVARQLSVALASNGTA
jgi:IclR family acetate operon transcriptional repressor